jgi:hypothetical protein
MVPGRKIVEQLAFITHEPKKETKDGKYYITLILRDDRDRDYVFKSSVIYDFDQSGSAHFDMSTVKTADFNYK